MINPLIKRDYIEALYERVDISKPTLQDLYELKTYIRKWSLLAGVYADPISGNNGIYKLVRGHSSNNIQDNDNWVLIHATDNIGTVNYQTPDPPDPYSVNVGDTWTELSTGSHFRLLLYQYYGQFDDSFDDTFYYSSKRMWVETTSPGCIDESIGLLTFTNSFDYTFDRDETIEDIEFNIWDLSFDTTFGVNHLFFDTTFDITFN